LRFLPNGAPAAACPLDNAGDDARRRLDSRTLSRHPFHPGRATGEFRHIWGASDVTGKKTDSFPGGRKMRLLIATLMAMAVFLSPLAASAESADVEAVITKVDTANLSLSLDDGKKYQAPEEFNFEGLEPGVKVVVFYTEVDGKRVINDLEIVQ
jgi:hypothetical protein